MILEVFCARILPLEQIAKRFTVRTTAAVIVIKHEITGSRHQLKLSREMGAVGEVRSAMQFENERVTLTFVVTWRIQHPTLDRRSINARGIDEPFSVSKGKRPEHIFIDLSELLSRTALPDHKVCRPSRTALSQREHPISHIKTSANIGPPERHATYPI